MLVATQKTGEPKDVELDQKEKDIYINQLQHNAWQQKAKNFNNCDNSVELGPTMQQMYMGNNPYQGPNPYSQSKK